jgi:hypothetical protein
VKTLRAFLAVPLFLAAAAVVLPAVSADDPPKGAKRKRVVSDMSGFELTPPDKLQKQTTVVGATRGGLKPPPPVPLAPYLAKVLGTQPLFQWTSRGKEFTFALQDEAGADVVRKAVADHNYRYDGPALAAGKTYTWTVQLPSGVASDAASIQVVDAAERQAVEAALGKVKGQGFDADLQRARVLGERRLWYDALAAYTDLIARHPDKAQAYEERGMILAQLPRTQAAADADFARADELGTAH